jgi:tetratricopeptide (TPR) repeat protein
VLALAFGGLGAYAERRFVEQPTADAKPATPGEPDQPGGPAPENAGPSAKDLSDRIAKVSERVDALTHQVANLPKPAPPPDLSDVQVKLADLGNQAEKVAPLEAAIKKIDARLVEIGQSVASLGDELHAHKARGGASRGPDPNLIPSPAPERPVAEEALEQGADLFQKKKYQDALDLFSKLEQTNPDDARVWYYAALAHGFAKKQWTDGTSRLVEKGIERERAGTPSGPVIDRTFKDLTSATGKEWLATYRKRVKDQ